MAYTISIGELEVEYEQEEGYIRLDAAYAERDDAPADGSVTDRTNQRWPAYLVWSEFCKASGLEELFFGKEDGMGIMNEHPGCVPLHRRHLDIVQASYDSMRAKYPDAEPKMEGPDQNYILARLNWLRYWMAWALENCKQPVFANH